MVNVVILKKASAENVQDLNALMKELRGKPSRGSLAELKSLLRDKNVFVVVGQEQRRIVAVGMLFIEQRVGERVAFVQDVVVGSAYRRQGLGEKIMKKLIRIAQAKKVDRIGLTSRPTRIAANKLYRKLGFKLRETNVYKLEL